MESAFFDCKVDKRRYMCIKNRVSGYFSVIGRLKCVKASTDIFFFF